MSDAAPAAAAPTPTLPVSDVLSAMGIVRDWIVEAGIHGDPAAILLEEVTPGGAAGTLRVAVSYPVRAAPDSVEAKRAEMMGFGSSPVVRTYKELLVDPASGTVSAFRSGLPAYESVAA